MADNSTLAQLAKELVIALSPLVSEDSAGTEPDELPEAVDIILQDAGIVLDRQLGSETVQTIEQILTQFSDSYKIIKPLVESDEPPTLSDVEQLLSNLQKMIASIQRLSDLELKAYEAEDVLTDVENLGQRLLEYLIIEYLLLHQTSLYHLLVIIGAIERGDPEAPHLKNRLDRIQFNALPAFIQDPKRTLSDLYHWNTADFAIYDLLPSLALLLQSLQLPAQFTTPDEADGQKLGWNSDGPDPDVLMRVPLIVQRDQVAVMQAGFALLPLRSTKAGVDSVAIVPFGVGTASQKVDLGNSWEFNYRVSSDVTVRYGIIITKTEIKVQELSQGTPLSTDFRAEFSVEQKQASGQRKVLFGEDDLAVVEAGSVSARQGLSFKNGEAEFFIEFRVRDARVVLSVSQGDGFLQKVLPTGGMNAPFDLTVVWSNRRGLYFHGGAGLSVTLPIHKDILGILKIQTIDLALVAGGNEQTGGTLEMVVAVSAAVKLGPFNASIERIGLRALTFPKSGGNLGVVNLEIGRAHV